MGVKVKERPPKSGVWWIFINHNGKRKSKRVGDRKLAEEAAAKIRARLVLGSLDLEEKEERPGPYLQGVCRHLDHGHGPGYMQAVHGHGLQEYAQEPRPSRFR